MQAPSGSPSRQLVELSGPLWQNLDQDEHDANASTGRVFRRGADPARGVPAGINPHIRKWVNDCVALCEPRDVFWCDGSADERAALIARGVREGDFIELNQQKLPGCYLHRSNPNDVARTEQCTFICTPSPRTWPGRRTTGWNPRRPTPGCAGCSSGCMRGRTMYVVPFVMGPIGSPLAKVGVQLTDSIYVAVSMGIMTRMGEATWRGAVSPPIPPSSRNSPAACTAWAIAIPNAATSAISRSTTPSGASARATAATALLGKKCLALRIASFLGLQQDWMAEHMLLLAATSPQGEKTYVAAAFPSACGKTNFAMLIPPPRVSRRPAGRSPPSATTSPGCGSMRRPAGCGRSIPRRAISASSPGTNEQTNPNAMATMSHDTIYTNVALLPDGDVWWEGKTAAAARRVHRLDPARNGRPSQPAARPRTPTAASPRR